MIASFDASNVRIETARLILRPWRDSDLQDFFEYASVDGVGQMAGWTPHQSVDESRKILKLFIQGNKTLALEYKQNGKVIGSVGLEEPDEDYGIPEDWSTRELGYVLSKSYWGMGLMPEAVRAVMDYCFQKLGFDYFTCSHFSFNGQSRRVIEKCGFHFLQESRGQALGKEEVIWTYIAFCPRYSRLNWLEQQINGIQLETRRLILRNFRYEDANDCFSFLHDRDGTYMDMGKEPLRGKNWEYWWFMHQFYGQKSRLMLELKDTHTVVGTVNMWPDESRVVKAVEIGFAVSPEHQRMGYALEALQEIIDFLFVSADIQMVTAGAVAHNCASIGLLQKLGFAYEGFTHKGFFCPDRGAVDLNCYYLEK